MLSCHPETLTSTTLSKMIDKLTSRKTKHEVFILNSIMRLRNEIIDDAVYGKGDLVAAKALLLRKYNRRLRLLKV